MASSRTTFLASLLARQVGRGVVRRGFASAAALGENEVAVNILAAPVSNTGKGGEGVGIVTAVGAKVKGIAVNDWVVPTAPTLDTFKPKAKAKEGDLAKVPSDIPVEYVANINTALTALQLVDSNAKPGDYIIQTDADSPVGLAVIQIAQSKCIGTINIVADGPGYYERAGLVKDLGGDVVVTDTYAASSPNFGKLLADLPKAKVGLSSGDKGAAALKGVVGKVITYGAGDGFAWWKKAAEGERKKAIDEVVGLFRSEALQLWVERHPFSDLQYALSEAKEPFKTRKVVLVGEQPAAPGLGDLSKLQADFESAFQKLKA